MEGKEKSAAFELVQKTREISQNEQLSWPKAFELAKERNPDLFRKYLQELKEKNH